MHIPDGFLDPTTCAVTGVIAVGALGWALRAPDVDADDRRLPLTGMAAATIFALQMCNFPVVAGTSGHLLGGALAAALLGPRLAVACMGVVAVVQTLLFADGGLSALGANITNMAVIGVLGAAAILAVLRSLLAHTRTGVLIAVAVAAGLTPALAAAGFVVQYSFGGNNAAAVSTVGVAMIGVHLAIGVGEAVLTVLTVSTVLALRPDLVHAARHLAPHAVTATPVVVPVPGGVR